MAMLVVLAVAISGASAPAVSGAAATARGAKLIGRAKGATAASAVSATSSPDSVVPFGAVALGSNALTTPATPVVGMAPTPDGKGYWLVASDGGIFTFGDAAFIGSEGGSPLHAPIVGMAPTPDGKGYWLVASDGGIFTFGDAGFFGSEGAATLNAPIVGMAPTPDGKGYWLVASDGGIFTFGDAAFIGSEGGSPLHAPIVGMAPAPDGKGYWLVASDGGVFTFGDAGFFGSEGAATLDAPIVGMAADPNGKGYWLVTGSQLPLAGKVVGIDPGHNGLNYSAPQIIDQPVWNGQEGEACDTTGTATDSGYSEAQYNFNVGSYLEADLEAEGAQVVMTRPNNDGIGPCVTTRAAILNDAHAAVAVDIHADGGPAGGRGFAVLEPVADGPNDAVIGSSDTFAAILRNTFVADTGMPVSTYDGVDGLQPRNDLAGLNLTTVPKVLIETGNMRNATDAALLVTPAFQQSAAAAMAQAITTYLTGRAS
jgi:N-acetylmuramoyl-L-alanine amidase/ribosomal protein L24E